MERVHAQFSPVHLLSHIGFRSDVRCRLDQVLVLLLLRVGSVNEAGLLVDGPLGRHNHSARDGKRSQKLFITSMRVCGFPLLRLLLWVPATAAVDLICVSGQAGKFTHGSHSTISFCFVIIRRLPS